MCMYYVESIGTECYSRHGYGSSELAYDDLCNSIYNLAISCWKERLILYNCWGIPLISITKEWARKNYKTEYFSLVRRDKML